MLNSLTLWILLGKTFNTPILEEFVKVWINMFTRSPKTKLAWSIRTGLPACSYILGYSLVVKWEMMKHLHDSFGDAKSLLEDESLSPSRLKLHQRIRSFK